MPRAVRAAFLQHAATLCRPGGCFTFDLVTVGPTAPNIERVFGKTEEACLDMLQAGTADDFTCDALSAKEDHADIAMTDRISDIPARA